MPFRDLGINLVPNWIRDDLSKIISNTRHIDTIPYIHKERHRGHGQHQFFVGALGDFFLDKAYIGHHTLLGYVCKKLKCTKNEVKIMWWDTALLHDHLYSLSYLFEKYPLLATIYKVQKEDALINKIFETYYNYLEQNAVHSKLLNLLKVFWDILKMEEADFQSFLNKPEAEEFITLFIEIINNSSIFLNARFEIDKNSPKLIYPVINCDGDKGKKTAGLSDHGLLAMLNILLLLRIEKKPMANFNGLQEVLFAITTHNLPNVEIEFDSHPFAFLLKLVDQIQEWDRYIIVNNKPINELTGIDIMAVGRKKKRIKLEDFEFGFVYQSRKDLAETKWDMHVLLKDKARQLSGLTISGRPFRIKCKIEISDEIN